jgi:uncharacterized protein
MSYSLGRIAVFLAGLLVSSGPVLAQEIQFFSIGTGGTGATYYPLGGTIANAISNPPGSRPCEEGGSCGVPGLIAMAQSSRGSVDNIDGIKTGRFHSGFVQSDVAYWAYTGTGVYDGQTPIEDLRAITALYPEDIQLIARKDAGITSVQDLKGKRVSLDERGSGSYVNAVQILDAFGLSEADLDASFLKSVSASDAVIAGDLDAFFITAGYPTNAIIELASRASITGSWLCQNAFREGGCRFLLTGQRACGRSAAWWTSSEAAAAHMRPRTRVCTRLGPIPGLSRS